MTGEFTRLDESDREEALAFLERRPRRNVVLLPAVTLSVEPDNPGAYRMYRNIGFVKDADWMIVSF